MPTCDHGNKGPCAWCDGPEKPMDARIEKALQDGASRGHRPESIEALRDIFSKASPEAVAVCRAWHGETFGFPGYGDPQFWVAVQVARAETAVAVVRSMARS